MRVVAFGECFCTQNQIFVVLNCVDDLLYIKCMISFKSTTAVF